MRSVVVVLPASIWAAMPMFLILSSGTVRGIKLPPVMRESFVGFRHAVDVVPFFDGPAAHVRGIVQFVCKLVGHALVGAPARVQYDPADRKTGTPVLRHFDGHLVIGAANPPRLHLEHRLAVLDG